MAMWSRFASENIQKLEVVRRLIASLKIGAQGKGVNYVPVRNSHGRTLEIRPSTYFGFKLKDLFYLYIAIGVVSFGGVILYTNLFIGPAKLALIPEGYNPKPWEYYQHPITRFFAKYAVPSEQEVYERTCHCLFVKKEIDSLKRLQNKIHDLMKKREDYQAWYFEKPESKYARHLHKTVKGTEEDSAKGPGWIIESSGGSF